MARVRNPPRLQQLAANSQRHRYNAVCLQTNRLKQHPLRFSRRLRRLDEVSALEVSNPVLLRQRLPLRVLTTYKEAAHNARKLAAAAP